MSNESENKNDKIIDKDKYKGCSTRAWRCEGQPYTELADAMAEIQRNGPDPCMPADIELWADAPLILEAYEEKCKEVERLREENTYLNHMLDGVDKHTLDHVAEQAQIKMHEAGQCYDFCIVCETEGEKE